MVLWQEIVRERNVDTKRLGYDNNVINKVNHYINVIIVYHPSLELPDLNQIISDRYIIIWNNPQPGTPLAILSLKNLIHGKDRKSKRERSVF